MLLILTIPVFILLRPISKACGAIDECPESGYHLSPNSVFSLRADHFQVGHDSSRHVTEEHHAGIVQAISLLVIEHTVRADVDALGCCNGNSRVETSSWSFLGLGPCSSNSSLPNLRTSSHEWTVTITRIFAQIVHYMYHRSRGVGSLIWRKKHCVFADAIATRDPSMATAIQASMSAICIERRELA